MRMSNKQQLYDSIRDTIKFTAISFSSSPVERDELVSLANFIFVKKVHRWKKDGGASFKTWFRKVLVRAMIDYHGAWERKSVSLDVLLEQGMEWEDPEPDPLKCLAVKDCLDAFSEEARHVVDIILEGPGGTLDVGGESGRSVLSKMKLHLKDQGWSGPMIGRTFKEIRQSLRKAW